MSSLLTCNFDLHTYGFRKFKTTSDHKLVTCHMFESDQTMQKKKKKSRDTLIFACEIP